MNVIQGLLIAAVIALLVYLLRSRTNAKAKAWVKVGYVLFVIAAIYAILRPNDTTVVANWLGVDRGTAHDLVDAVGAVDDGKFGVQTQMDKHASF